MRIGAAALTEKWPRDTTRRTFSADVRSFVTTGTGGGIVAAPLVYVGRGIALSDNPPPISKSLFGLANPALGTLLEDYADDYARVDVRDKVVLVVRFYGFRQDTFDANGQVRFRRQVAGIAPEEAVASAIKRGAAAIIYIDPDLAFYTDVITNPPLGPINPYTRAERESPATATGGVPVVVLSGAAGAGLGSQLGLDVTRLMGWDTFGQFDHQPSASRELGVPTRVEVPIARRELRTTSYVGEVDGASTDAAHVLVWSIRGDGDGRSSVDVMSAVARSLVPRRTPFIFVDFDPSLDPRSNAAAVLNAIGERRIVLVIVLNELRGDALQFATPWGDLIPALDRYAQVAGARAIATRDTAPRTLLSDTAPFSDTKTIFISGSAVGGNADLRGDAAAVLGYLAGRLAVGAEELPR